MTPPRTAISATVAALLAAATALNVAIFLAAYTALQRAYSLTVESTSYSYDGDDYPSQLPYAIQPAELILEDTERYGLANDVDWDSIMPSGNGFIRLGPQGRVFAISMYHQLHCIDALRLSMYRHRQGLHNVTDPNPNHVSEVDEPSHADHCYNFLRQALLCAADTTLEVAEVRIRKDGQPDFAATGLGMKHTCRDWTQVRRIVEENTAQWRGIPFPETEVDRLSASKF